MKTRRNMSRCRGVATPAQYFIIQLGGKSRPLLRKRVEQRSQLPFTLFADALGRGTKTLLAVFTRLDQIVEYTDNFFVLFGHSSLLIVATAILRPNQLD